MSRALESIFKKVTEQYDIPVRIGSRCEAQVFYRVEDLSEEDLETCAEYIADRIIKVCQPNLPDIIIQLPGSFTQLSSYLSRELAPRGENLEIISLDRVHAGNGIGTRLKNARVVLVNDVITTARSCLEAHTQTTVIGATVMCWAALVDRTFGPGPVPVVAAHTGEPVRLLE